eukprot:732306-Prorocentrum_minimum.AAC.1
MYIILSYSYSYRALSRRGARALLPPPVLHFRHANAAEALRMCHAQVPVRSTTPFTRTWRRQRQRRRRRYTFGTLTLRRRYTCATHRYLFTRRLPSLAPGAGGGGGGGGVTLSPR